MKERLGEIGWIVCLAGLPWSYFLIRLVTPFSALDVWHANAWWMQGWMVALMMLTAGSTQVFGPLPAPCWWLMGWMTLPVLWLFTSQLKPGAVYPVAMLMAVGNAWMAFLLLLMMRQWNPQTLSMVMEAIFWSGASLVVYGWLQVLQLDEFAKPIDNRIHQDLLVGTIGNPTHFACQLAIWLPLALIRPGWHKLWALAGLGLLACASSSTALLTAGVVLLAWVWRVSRRAALGLGMLAGMIGALAVQQTPNLLDAYGRLAVWEKWWELFVKHPILGWGLGFTKQVAQQIPRSDPLFTWKHLHQEYFQFGMEAGLVGLALLILVLWTCWQRRRSGVNSPLRWACGMTVVACLVVSLLNFPWHLWQLGAWPLAGLAGWLGLTESVRT